MQLNMDARNHFAMRARIEMHQGNYQEALRFLSMALNQIPPFLGKVAAPLLADRAECFWQLGHAGKAVQEMMNARDAGLPAYGENSEEEAWTWTNRGFCLFRGQSYHLAECCASVALHFNNPFCRPRTFLCRALSRYQLGDIHGTLSDAKEIKKLDNNYARGSAHDQKEAAIQLFQQHNYEEALKLLKLALLLHPEDSSALKFRRSVESHQAAAYFKLRQYRKALEVGETSYRSNSSLKSTEEAKRWKERGNHLSKEPNSVELAIAYYSLALSYTPPNERDLKATILSNRSLMYQKTGKDEEALRDAQQCVQNNPNWAKAQYRLGSCLFARERFKEALDAFSRSLHSLLNDSSSSEKDRMATLNQLLQVALKHPGGTSGVHYGVPRNLLQTVITETVDDKDWDRLHLLFMGGGGEKRFQKGSGGLGTGCDASSVPLEEVIHCDFKDLTDFISVLLDHKASSDPPKGRENPVDVAIQLDKFDVVNILMNRCKKAGPSRETTSTSKPVKRTFKADALEAIRKDDNGKAIELLKLSLKHEKSGIEEERKTLKSLCELYFREASFKECLETGKKLKATFWGEKSEDNNSFRIEQAKQWKKWGNELHKESKYEFMAEFYSLALAFTPLSNKEITTALLSNRCLAFNKLEKFKEALADAEECIKIKPEWFRGHSRQGTCLCHLKRKEEALEAFCKAHTYALTEKDKNATANDVVFVAMDIEDGESRITCHFSPDTLQHLVKETSERNEWKKLRFLFLGSAASMAARGVCFECDASCVPLDLLIESNVEDLHNLVFHLLQRGALPDGLKECRRPPLLAAMEMRKFPLAVTLLRNQADPSCIVGHGIYINKEGQPKQWLHLGRKAVESSNHKKAVLLLNMCIHLSDPGQDVSILTAAYQALAEAHFKLEEHEQSINAGKECFKLRPHKSEDEAKSWHFRASHIYDLGLYLPCIECINLALKYTPAESTRTFSLLLCQRSKAERQLGQYISSLEDAKRASMMTPDMLEGYLNQYRCLQALNRGSEAMQAINECLKRTTNETLLGDLVNNALDIAVTLEERTLALTNPIRRYLLVNLLNYVIETKDWNKLKVLYLGGGGPSSLPVGVGGLATNIDIVNVPLGEVIRHLGLKDPLLISVLVEHGASVNLIGGSDVIPLNEAMNKEQLPLVEMLVQKGANCCATDNEGEPIIHKALRKGLSSGDFRFLEAMIKSKNPEIENVRDASDSTLYHIVCAGRKPSKKSLAYDRKCDAIQFLREANVNPNLANKKGLRPLEMVSKKDHRWKMISTSIASYRSNTTAPSSSEIHPEIAFQEEKEIGKSEVATEDEDWSGGSELGLTREEEISASTGVDNSNRLDDKHKNRIQLRQNIDGLIEALSPLVSVPTAETVEPEDNDILDESSPFLDITETEKTPSKDQNLDVSVIHDYRQTDTSEQEVADDKMEAKIDFKTPFEDLPWEVDCTDRVWKIMRSKKVDNNMRKGIIEKVQMLANGRWSKKLCKRLEGEPKKHGIHLYESRLTKGQRILWEVTVAFSGRLSDLPENRLKEETSDGRIYSDIIRVWDIVLDHDKLQRSIDHIVKSHDRGMHCLIKKKLKGIPAESRNANTTAGERLPNKYVEIADPNIPTESIHKKNIPKKTPLSENLPQMFFPPASANEQEYHILKFYSFNTPLVKTVLESDTSTKVDFPFKITELEHAIVNLRPDPPAPIILLGRSGTGKTTCCLYRLWDNFQRYWESAATAGPHIPQYSRPLKGCGTDSEVESLPRSPEQVACGPDRSPLTKCNEFEDYAMQDEETSHKSSSSDIHLSRQGFQCEDDVPDNSNGPCMYEHLHQIFITKNNVLCSEVEKNFKELCRACQAAEQRLQFEDRPTPKKIQDVAEEEWPLFVNSRDWLLMLDASLPGEPFFKRAEDGTLERKIDGWGEDDNHLQFIPASESDVESDEEEDDEEKTKGPKDNRDPRREITYHVFQHEIWPKMRKSSKEKFDYHPTLVWTEIRSFIKGSAEALMSENGFLSLEDYESLGRKKAPNFSANRKVVYDLFLVYQQQRSRYRMFDEADLVFNIHRRLQSSPGLDWSIHQFYVDETQDFTQAELSLLIRCCRFPNELFFTGDTAQSIMRGIAFRFDDLKTLFHHARKAVAIKEGHHNFIRVPKKLYQLTHNYRSHAGILRLASSVVDLLLYYFPDSFDRLQKDEGLFEGPKPVLLEACSPTDLALILQGNQRQSSRIEFGAHQVVLVVSNEAREAMPDELKQGLVMTIYEAKGLEFDDVLIYNFFKDSQAGKEWRVVTRFVEQQNMVDASGSTGLTEITEESVQVKSSRPLEFDPEKHKVLNSEFKYLYTAITRARVNVWFFDENEEARAPVFEYFRSLKLVNVVTLEDQGKGRGQLASMFAVKSTPEEWRKGGMRFYKKRLWVAAIQCFTFAGDNLMLQKSQAQQQAAEAIKFRSTNRQMMRDEFLRASESFLQCEMYDEAAICLNNAREWILLARLYEKTGKHQDAARLFKKKGLFQEASRCFESQNNYRDAIEILCSASHIEEALKAMERFKILSSSADLEGRQGIIPPKDTRTVERMRHQLADKYFKEGNNEKMEEVLQHLPSTTDRITFLKKRGCVIEAARVMGEEGKRDEAAALLKNEGMFQEAIKYSNDPRFTADCLLLQVRTTRNTKDTPAILHMALEKYQKCQNRRGQAEALLMLGELSNDVEKIQEASRLFHMCKNVHGEAESVAELLKATHHSPPETFSQWHSIRALEGLLRLVALLYQPAGKHSMAERNEVQICEEHFGLFTTDSEQTRVYFCKRGGRFSRVDPQFIERNSSKSEATIPTTDARQMIGKFLIGFSVTFADMIREMLENTLLRNSVCRQETEESSCDNTSCEYQHEDSEELFYNRFHTLLNFVYLNSVVKQGVFEMTGNKLGSDIPLGFKRFVENHQEFDDCQRFYNFLFPPSGYRRYLIKGFHISRVTAIKAVKRRIFQFSEFLWKEKTKERRRADTDNFLKVSSSLQLIGSSPVMLKWICEEENQFKREKRKLFNTTRDDLVRNGMVQKKDTGIYESYLHWWEIGKRKLYVSGYVENAAHEIIRSFLTLTAKRSGMIYPSIANTVMIIEYQLTACLALYANLCTHHRYPICLPESYLVMVRFWDNVRPNVDKGTFTLYEAVEHNARQERYKQRLLKATCKILDYMVRLTCGDVAPRFDVLGDALSSDDSPTYSTSGEVERSLVLFLTMLCNCGKGISTSVEGIMLKNIFSLKPNPRLPKRIKNAVMEVQEAKGFCDVVAVFDKFLQSRGERLYDLRWHNGKLWFDGSDGPSNPNNYRERFYTDTSNIREELGKMLVETPHRGEAVGEDKEDSGEVDFDATEEDIEVKYTEEDLREKENARSEVVATKIQRWYRGVKQVKEIPARNLERLKSIEEQSKASTSAVEERFSKFKLDSSACGICGVHFTSLDDYQEEYDGALPDKQVENVEDHRKSSAHCQKQEQFQQYKEIYLAEIHPCLVKEKELRNMIDDISSSGDKRGTEDVALDLERLETTLSLVKKDVQTIETSLEWENTGSLLKAAEKLGASLKGLFKLLEQAKTDLVMDEPMTGNDETEDQDDKLGEDEGEDSFMDIHMDVPKKRRKYKRKKRSQATDTTAFP